MTTILPEQHYYFNSLDDWKRFYEANKTYLDGRGSKWLNFHLHISEGNRGYKITRKGKRMYLKPYIKIQKPDPEDALKHMLEIILDKLNDIDSANNHPRSGTTDSGGNDAARLPHKSVIERIKTIKPHKDDEAD